MRVTGGSKSLATLTRDSTHTSERYLTRLEKMEVLDLIILVDMVGIYEIWESG
jgi:hypothetical protein